MFYLDCHSMLPNHVLPWLSFDVVQLCFSLIFILMYPHSCRPQIFSSRSSIMFYLESFCREFLSLVKSKFYSWMTHTFPPVESFLISPVVLYSSLFHIILDASISIALYLRFKNCVFY